MTRFLVPLGVFVVLAVILAIGVERSPTKGVIASPLIGKPAPQFVLPRLAGGESFDSRQLAGKWYVLNVWGTWCVSCRVEHPVLNKLSQMGVTIYGVNYKDDNAAALKWLKEFHNPYQLDIRDEQGSLGLNLGVYGAPETFLIDKDGIIRHKFVGVIDDTVWREQLAPLYQSLVDGEDK